MSEIPTLRPKWRGTMTDRERFVKQMHYQPVDRCFNMEFGYWDENYRQWDIFVDNGIQTEEQANQAFSFDRMGGIGGNVWMKPPFESKQVGETETTYIIMNGDGLLAEIPKAGQSTIPHFMEATIKTPDDWQRAKEERFRRDDPARRVDIEALQQQHPADRDYPLAVGCGSMIGNIRNVLTFEGLAFATYDYPDMVEDMVETACVLVEDFLDQVLPHFDFDLATGWEDICFKNGPIISVPFFTSVIVPRYARIGKKLRAAGVDLWWTDCDGDVRPLIPGFLEAGLNTMFPFEVNGSGHPGETLDKYGPELRIVGGFDKLEMIKGKEHLRAYMESLAPWVERGGFIPHCDHRCPPDVTPENYLYYLDLKERMFGL
jgi:uroporphyrinogen decarboxylase